jgi:hypothetical protein
MKALTLLLFLALCFAGCGKESWHHATVIGKTFTPGSTGVGPSTGKGGGIVVLTTDEQYNLILKFDDGSVSSVEVKSEEWAEFEKGDSVEADVRWWGIEAVKK